MLVFLNLKGGQSRGDPVISTCGFLLSGRICEDKHRETCTAGQNRHLKMEIIRNHPKSTKTRRSENKQAVSGSKIFQTQFLKTLRRPFYLFFHRHSPFMNGDIPIFPNILARIVPPIINQSISDAPIYFTTPKQNKQNHGEILQSPKAHHQPAGLLKTG